MMTFKQVGPKRIKSVSLTALVFLSSFLFLNLAVFPLPIVRATVYSVTSDDDMGIGTLRQAIMDSNSAGSGNIITFSAGAHTITLSSPLPNITQPVIIDGSANVDGNGNPRIEIIGTNAGDSVDGLVFLASNITLKSLIINSFGGNGVNIQGPGSNNNTISNSFIGTGATGNAAQANDSGIKIQSSSNNIIGGTTSGTRNIISGNTNNGVWILGPNASGNFVYGNYIGIGLGGAAIPNRDGVRLEGATTSRIGTNTTINARNIISGNTGDGVLIAGALTTSNQVMGNYIGTNIGGNAAIANNNGVQVLGAPTNTIGGSISGMGNLISGNNLGILLKNSGTTGNLVEGNFIGTDATGSLPLPNVDGVVMDNAPGNTIGGSTVSRRNIISGNKFYGVYIIHSPSTANKVLGNYLGTDVGGTLPLPNETGIVISNAGSNLVGDIGGSDGNVISGNTNYGIIILGSGATNNQVRHNLIGVNKDGTSALPNNYGIYFSSSNSNILGGTINPPGNRNVISGNTGAGIIAFGAADTLIQGNFIGLSLSGLVGIPNFDGILLDSVSGTIIGKADAGILNNYRNYITSNTNSGLTVTGTSNVPNESIGNMIGYKGDDTLFAGVGKSLIVFNGGRLKLTGRNRIA